MRGVAHPGGPLAPHNLWGAWNLEPLLLLSLAGACLVYLWGSHNVWQSAGVGHGITLRRLVYFAGAMLALGAALVSPLDALSGVLFSAHMTQHLILILVAAPLLVLSDFPLAFLWALPRRWAQSWGQGLKQSKVISTVGRLALNPVTGWVLFAVALWGWHASKLYQAALQNEMLHLVEHLVFLGTAGLFWWVLFKHTTAKHLHYGVAIPYLFTTALHSGVLGALMTFTTEPWYPYYAAFVPLWGLTLLQDQQVAGLVMWIPGGVVFTLLAIGYFASWLRALEQRSVQLTSPHAVDG